MESADASEEEIGREVVREIILAVKSVRYGSVEVVIQDATVVQIEIKEKVRFGKDGLRVEKRKMR